ncbi:MAG: DNA gyrase subunit A [Bacteriovoracales bacterium]|nr:DNA gyrase subunit A [Bacteriovoracales bacterium]
MTEQVQTENISSLNIQDEMRDSYLDYAMSVIAGRALPDVRDGLKPVHRRILYAMSSLNNFHNRPFLKSARIVGDVIGKYHPHGDGAVYNTIVRMAQDFSLRYPLIDGQGNFGSIDGDNAAAMRYTEIRMDRITGELLKDLEKDTVDWKPNYDDSLNEPGVLPTKVPNLLINGSSGIAVGMATNIPPHNLTEVMKALVALVDNPELSVDQLMEYIPGPDFPTAGSIQGTVGIKMAYLTGRGVLQIRAKAEIETFSKDRERIIVTEIPYQVNKAKLIEKIAFLVNNKQITGISNIRDETNKLGIRIVIDIKRGESASVILNKLYKQTQFQVSFGIIFLSIHNGQPKVMGLKGMLTHFIDHRREIVLRRTAFELKKAKEKAHLLEGFKKVVENVDEIVALIKGSSNPSEAKSLLIERYSLSEIQSQSILEMRLQRLTGLEREKILKDYEEILKTIKDLQNILADDGRVKEIIKDEFYEVLEKYGDERKTEIVAKVDEVQIIDLIKEENVIITITHKGYVKRMAANTYRSQRRGGKGVKGAEMDDDFFTKIFMANTHDDIYFFSSGGKVYCKKVYELPEGTRTSKGRNVINLIPLSHGEKIKDIIPISKEMSFKDKFIVMATEKGLIKKSKFMDYRRIQQSGLKAIKIAGEDSICSVRITTGKQEILLCSSGGRSVRFSEEDCRPLGRVSQGVKGMSLDTNERLIGMEIISDDDQILSVTEKGYGKRTKASEYPRYSRGGKGVIAIKGTDRNGDIIGIKSVKESDDLMIVTNKGQVIRTKVSEISIMGRNTQGVRLMKPKGGEKIVSIENTEEIPQD